MRLNEVLNHYQDELARFVKVSFLNRHHTSQQTTSNKQRLQPKGGGPTTITYHHHHYSLHQNYDNDNDDDDDNEKNFNTLPPLPLDDLFHLLHYQLVLATTSIEPPSLPARLNLYTPATATSVPSPVLLPSSTPPYLVCSPETTLSALLDAHCASFRYRSPLCGLDTATAQLADMVSYCLRCLFLTSSSPTTVHKNQTTLYTGRVLPVALLNFALAAALRRGSLSALLDVIALLWELAAAATTTTGPSSSLRATPRPLPLDTTKDEDLDTVLSFSSSSSLSMIPCSAVQDYELLGLYCPVQLLLDPCLTPGKHLSCSALPPGPLLAHLRVTFEPFDAGSLGGLFRRCTVHVLRVAGQGEGAASTDAAPPMPLVRISLESDRMVVEGMEEGLVVDKTKMDVAAVDRFDFELLLAHGQLRIYSNGEAVCMTACNDACCLTLRVVAMEGVDVTLDPSPSWSTAVTAATRPAPPATRTLPTTLSVCTASLQTYFSRLLVDQQSAVSSSSPSTSSSSATTTDATASGEPPCMVTHGSGSGPASRGIPDSAERCVSSQLFGDAGCAALEAALRGLGHAARCLPLLVEKKLGRRNDGKGERRGTKKRSAPCTAPDTHELCVAAEHYLGVLSHVFRDTFGSVFNFMARRPLAYSSMFLKPTLQILRAASDIQQADSDNCAGFRAASSDCGEGLLSSVLGLLTQCSEPILRLVFGHVDGQLLWSAVHTLGSSCYKGVGPCRALLRSFEQKGVLTIIARRLVNMASCKAPHNIWSIIDVLIKTDQEKLGVSGNASGLVAGSLARHVAVGAMCKIFDLLSAPDPPFNGVAAAALSKTAPVEVPVKQQQCPNAVNGRPGVGPLGATALHQNAEPPGMQTEESASGNTGGNERHGQLVVDRLPALHWNLEVLQRLLKALLPAAHRAFCVAQNSAFMDHGRNSGTCGIVIHEGVVPCLSYLSSLTRLLAEEGTAGETWRRKLRLTALQFLLRIWLMVLRLTLKSLLFLKSYRAAADAACRDGEDGPLVTSTQAILAICGNFLLWFTDLPHALKSDRKRSALPGFLVAGCSYLPAPSDHELWSVEHWLRRTVSMLQDSQESLTSLPASISDFLTAQQPRAASAVSRNEGVMLPVTHGATRVPLFAATAPGVSRLRKAFGPTCLVRKLMKESSSVDQLLGSAWKPFHSSTLRVQRAITAVLLHLLGYDPSAVDSHFNRTGAWSLAGSRTASFQGEEDRQLRLACHLSHKAVMRVLAAIQQRGTCAAQTRREVMDRIVARCEWILRNCSRGLYTMPDAEHKGSPVVRHHSRRELSSLSYSECVWRRLPRSATSESCSNTPPISCRSAETGLVVVRRDPQAAVLHRSVTRNLGVLRRLLHHRRSKFDRHAIWSCAITNSDGGELPLVDGGESVTSTLEGGSGISVTTPSASSDRAGEAEILDQVLDFLVSPTGLASIEEVEDDIRVEQLGAICRFITLRSVQALFSVIMSEQSLGVASRACPTSPALTQQPAATLVDVSRRRVSSACATKLSMRTPHMKGRAEDDSLLQHNHYWSGSPRAAGQHALVLELLLPTNPRASMGSDDGAFCLRRSGWMLLRLFRSLTVLLRAVRPVCALADSLDEPHLGTGSFWARQPFHEALQTSLNDIVQFSAQWHLRRNVRLLLSVEDELWMAASLEILVLHICLGTAALDSVLEPLLRHLLHLATTWSSGALLRERCWELFQAAMWTVLVLHETRTSAKETAVNVVLCVLIDITDERTIGGEDEELLASLLNLLHGCVKYSASSATLVLKAFMTARDLQPANLDQMLRCLRVKPALYRLVTDCVRAAQVSAPPRATAFRTPSSSPTQLQRLNSSLLLQCLPPIVPLATGGILDAGRLYMSRSDENVPTTPGLSRVTSHDVGGSTSSSMLSPSTPHYTDDAGGASTSMVLPPVPTPPRYNPFDSLPQSHVYLCAVPMADFEAVPQDCFLRVTRAQNLGGVVLCRVPLTFPALCVPDNQPTDIINFRLPTAGRFGVTVAPADCILRTATEVFTRNDVVGFKTSTCPDFWQNVFAAECEYQPGDLLDVKFNVEAQVAGGDQLCLRTELMVSGLSIGSVLEVFFERRTQIEQQERMNLVFVFQDPMTIMYDGPLFSLEYTENSANNQASEDGSTDLEGESVLPEDELAWAWADNRPSFMGAVELYQAIVVSDNAMLHGLKADILSEICCCLKSVSVALTQLPRLREEDDEGAGWSVSTGGATAATIAGGLNAVSTDLGCIWGNTGESPSNIRPPSSLPSESFMLLCKRAAAALAIIACDVTHVGDLKDALKPLRGDAKRHRKSRSKYQGLPWLTGQSQLRKSVGYGLTTGMCQQLLSAVVGLLEVPAVADILYQVATAGPLPRASGENCVLKCVLVYLGTKAVLASCLLTRTLLHLQPEGLLPGGHADTTHVKLLDFFQKFCFASAVGRPDGRVVPPTCGTDGSSGSADFAQIAALCGVPDALLKNSPAPPVIGNTSVMPAHVTGPVWNWLHGLSDTWRACAHQVVPGPVGRVEGDWDISASIPMTTRVFSFDGFHHAPSKRLQTGSRDSLATWALKKDVLDTVCSLAGLVPRLFVSRLRSDVSLGKMSEEQPQRSCALDILRLFRICVYYISREKDDRALDYWHRLHPDASSELAASALDVASSKADPLYGWQRVFYQAVCLGCREPSNTVLHLLQTEVLFHLIGSVAQVTAATRQSRSMDLQGIKFCSLAPSVFVAHWLLDVFVRHPLCPGAVRRATLFPLTYTSLLALIGNGSNIPMKLGVDAARLAHWIFNTPSRLGGCQVTAQNIFDCLTFCGHSVLEGIDRTEHWDLASLDCVSEGNVHSSRRQNCGLLSHYLASAAVCVLRNSNAQWRPTVNNSLFQKLVLYLMVAERVARKHGDVRVSQRLPAPLGYSRTVSWAVEEDGEDQSCLQQTKEQRIHSSSALHYGAYPIEFLRVVVPLLHQSGPSAAAEFGNVQGWDVSGEFLESNCLTKASSLDSAGSRAYEHSGSGSQVFAANARLCQHIHHMFPTTLDFGLKKLLDVVGSPNAVVALVAQSETPGGFAEKLLPDKSSPIWREIESSPSEARDLAYSILEGFRTLYARAKAQDTGNCKGAADEDVQTTNHFDSASAGVVYTPTELLTVSMPAVSEGSTMDMDISDLATGEAESFGGVSPGGHPTAANDAELTSAETSPLADVLNGRLRLLEQLNSYAADIIPIIATVFNSPSATLDEHGLLTAEPVGAFFGGNHYGVPQSFLCPHCGRGTLPPRSLSKTELTDDPRHSRKMVLHVGPADLPIELSVYLFMRPLMKLELVVAMWKDMMVKLGAGSQDKCTVKVDRGLAATAKSLTQTLWYQSTKQILDIAPSRLRSKPGDRPLMVVFRGEGATDFGGPFHELVSCLSSEIMGQLGDIGDKKAPFYSACIPCPNSTHAIGPNQDTVVLSPFSSPYSTADSFITSELLRLSDGTRRPPLPGPTKAASFSMTEKDAASTTTSLVAQFAALQPPTKDPGDCGSEETLRQRDLRRSAGENKSSDLNAEMCTTHPHTSANSQKSQYRKRRGNNDDDASTGLDSRTLAAVELGMFESLGRTMGMCLSTATALDVSLNSVIWKKLVGYPIGLEDLRDADIVAVEMLWSLKLLAAEGPDVWDDEARQSLGDLHFQAEDSAGNSFELVQGGADIPVSEKNLPQFIRLSERCRLLEAQAGINRVLKGLGAVVPLGRIRLLFPPSRLEYIICGSPEIDLILLQNHTTATEPLKTLVFGVLEAFTGQQLQNFLRFVSGRSRMPTVTTDWRLSIEWENVDALTQQQGSPPTPAMIDSRLPTAATCALRLVVPRYSSPRVLREKLLYAIGNCVAIDLDAYAVDEQMQFIHD